jgi:hypothetical protein
MSPPPRPPILRLLPSPPFRIICTLSALTILGLDTTGITSISPVVPLFVWPVLVFLKYCWMRVQIWHLKKQVRNMEVYIEELKRWKDEKRMHDGVGGVKQD